MQQDFIFNLSVMREKAPAPVPYEIMHTVTAETYKQAKGIMFNRMIDKGLKVISYVCSVDLEAGADDETVEDWKTMWDRMEAQMQKFDF